MADRPGFGLIIVMVLLTSAITAGLVDGKESEKAAVQEKRPSTHREIRQPYENAGEWAWVAPIDGPGYCGPASLYHIIHYFGDVGEFHTSGKALDKDGSQAVTIPDLKKENHTFIDHTPFGRFMQPNTLGSGWTMLKKVELLTRSKNSHEPLYRVFVCSAYTKPKAAEIRKLRLEFIRDRFLNRNIPVVIHLRSGIPFYGHYVTLIGYDAGKAMVYYVDSLRSGSGIQRVSADDFLGKPFYVSGRFYKARWDGEWMAIWHPDTGIECGHCGEGNAKNP